MTLIVLYGKQWPYWMGNCIQRDQMETFSALLALCAGKSPVTDEFPSQRPVTRSFDVFFDFRLNKRLSKPSRLRWFEMPSCSLWRHCYDMHTIKSHLIRRFPRVVTHLQQPSHRYPLTPLDEAGPGDDYILLERKTERLRFFHQTAPTRTVGPTSCNPASSGPMPWSYQTICQSRECEGTGTIRTGARESALDFNCLNISLVISDFNS